MAEQPASFQLFDQAEGIVQVSIAGCWAAVKPEAGKPDCYTQLLDNAKQRLEAGNVSQLHYETRQLTRWDSRFLALLIKVESIAREHQIQVVREGLPQGAVEMLRLAEAVPPKETERGKQAPLGFLETVGSDTLMLVNAYGRVAEFVGEAILSLGRFFRGKAIYYRKDLITFLRQAGPEALSLIILLNLLMGVIVAFMGAIQLEKFGAQIYVADMVAIGITRELVPMMTAIIIAGRTGAAYAAQLGTMMVNQEIDALKSFGFSPIDFLVTPRMVSLSIMVPILIIYGDVMGLLGGFLIGVGMLDLSPTLYLIQTRNAIGIGDIMFGVVKGSVFGILVAICGCLLGINCGRNAAAVGQATTGAVVSSIVCIVIATAIFSVLSNALGI